LFDRTFSLEGTRSRATASLDGPRRSIDRPVSNWVARNPTITDTPAANNNPIDQRIALD